MLLDKCYIVSNILPRSRRVATSSVSVLKLVSSTLTSNITPYSEKITRKTKNFTPNNKTFTQHLFFSHQIKKILHETLKFLHQIRSISHQIDGTFGDKILLVVVSLSYLVFISLCWDVKIAKI